MNTMVSTENFPTELCSREAKEQFARAVLKERANKRKLQVYRWYCGGQCRYRLEQCQKFFPGNSARVLPPLKGSPWVRVCSATGPAGTLKQKLKHSKIELTPNHKVPSLEIIITKFVLLIRRMSALVLVGSLSWWTQCIRSCFTKSWMKLQLKLRTVCVMAVWLDTSVCHAV